MLSAARENAIPTSNTLEKRSARIDAVIALKEPDRVPFGPKLNMAYCQAGGIDIYEGMMDPRNMADGLRKFLTRYELDLCSLPAGYPIPVMELLGTGYIKWPGQTHALSLNTGHQILDKAFLEEAEYDEFIDDPTAFFLSKVYPRRHSALSGLRKVAFDNISSSGHFLHMGVFAEPETAEAFDLLRTAGRLARSWADAEALLAAVVTEMQSIPANPAALLAPYDMLADMLRGYINVPMDLFQIPEKVEAAIAVMERIALKSVAAMHKRRVRFCFMPLHGGTDEFMSDETYRRYYWPSLKRVIDRLLACGITPYIFCEGKYNTRIEILSELPPGKTILMFEQVDIGRAKRLLGGIACIGGNFPATSLIFGKREDVVEETKRMLDICAPGGGFIMDCSIVLDHYDEKLFDAWYETTLRFGCYS